jgi:hypothetical protein
MGVLKSGQFLPAVSFLNLSGPYLTFVPLLSVLCCWDVSIEVAERLFLLIRQCQRFCRQLSSRRGFTGDCRNRVPGAFPAKCAAIGGSLRKFGL